MIVVHHLPGTRSVRVRWLCAEVRLDAETRLIAYPPTVGFLELNPFGTVPLVEVDGLRLVDSAAALIYLAQSRNLNDLLPAPDAPGYGDVLNWTILGESQLGMHANVLLAARFLAPEGAGDTPETGCFAASPRPSTSWASAPICWASGLRWPTYRSAT